MRVFFCGLCFLILINFNSLAVDFAPPEEAEEALLNENLNTDEIICWEIVSIGTAAAGITVSTIGIYSIFNNIVNGFDDSELQAGVVMTVGGGVLTAAAAIILGFIFNETDMFE